jgi:hypothetical protein
MMIPPSLFELWRDKSGQFQAGGTGANFLPAFV